MTRHVSDEERRARIAVRHALHPGTRGARAEDALRAMSALHATEASTVHLACRARGSPDMGDVERALYDDRRLVKQLAMRRTLWAVAPELLPALWGSASARVADQQRARMVKDLVGAHVTVDGDRWLRRARTRVLDVLVDHPEGLTAAALRERAPALAVTVPSPGANSWSVGRILTLLGARGDVVRGANLGDWRRTRPRWTLPRHWLGEDVGPPMRAADGYRELIARWLWSFGPGTEEDIVWWLGATKAAVRRALRELEAVTVTLDGGAVGHVLPDDLAEVPDPGPWVALLPVLDPTVMGWRERGFYLDPQLRTRLFDRNGNAGTTVWVDGRVVGSWVQDDDGAVTLRLLAPVPAARGRELDREARALTEWLGGARVTTAFPSPAMR